MVVHQKTSSALEHLTRKMVQSPGNRMRPLWHFGGKHRRDLTKRLGRDGGGRVVTSGVPESTKTNRGLGDGPPTF